MGFDWDSGNWPKCGKHGLSQEEIELCFNGVINVAPDPYPAHLEERYKCSGREPRRAESVHCFMLRHTANGNLIRPISAQIYAPKGGWNDLKKETLKRVPKTQNRQSSPNNLLMRQTCLNMIFQGLSQPNLRF